MEFEKKHEMDAFYGVHKAEERKDRSEEDREGDGRGRIYREWFDGVNEEVVEEQEGSSRERLRSKLDR